MEANSQGDAVPLCWLWGGGPKPFWGNFSGFIFIVRYPTLCYATSHDFLQSYVTSTTLFLKLFYDILVYLTLCPLTLWPHYHVLKDCMNVRLDGIAYVCFLCSHIIPTTPLQGIVMA